jgi:hypothetical protein
MPPAVSTSISVRCMSCRHHRTIDAATLKRFGLKPEAPIASFIKRLRCTKCRSGSVMVERVSAAPSRRAS